MEDLLFKNIPAEGFDPNCGFTDRISNPTPSRSNSDSAVEHEQCPSLDDRLSSVQTRDSSIAGYSDVTDRLSNVAPSRRNLSAKSVPQYTQPPCEDSERMSSAFDASRASNPTPSRRGSAINTSPSADDYSRVSNPTPTRRLQNVFFEPPVTFSGVATEIGEDLSRASNPTPTRRSTEKTYETSAIQPSVADHSQMTENVESRLSNITATHQKAENTSQFFDSETTESLTFESAENPYGVGLQPETDVSRASNPTPTRRTLQSPSIKEDSFNDDSDRLSNYIPSRHK